MPYGLKRYQQVESLHFITFSCYRRLPFLSDPDSKFVIEHQLEQTRARHQARIYAYVIMPEHIHLLMNEPPAIVVAQFLKSFKQETSRLLKGDRKQFWQIRYYDRNISGEEERSSVIRYIHRNPVKRGLVTAPELYPWSSFRHYSTGERRTIEIESEWTAAHRKSLSSPCHSIPRAPFIAVSSR
jgi:putative transposase